MKQWMGLSLMMLAAVSGVSVAAGAKQTIGWVETVRVTPGNVVVKAKIDTGAKMSSLGCDCRTEFERDGKRWMRFSVEDEHGELATFERPIIRKVRIKRHFGQAQERVVVDLGVCLGNQYKVTQVNLVDRSGFIYPMLIGRDDLAGRFVVDPQQKFRSRPNCAETPKLE